jgi:hypothetical protein
VLNGNHPSVGNIEISRHDPIDSIDKVTEAEQTIRDHLRDRDPLDEEINGTVVVTNWILLAVTSE